jgi:hypothetical protein
VRGYVRRVQIQAKIIAEIATSIEDVLQLAAFG